MNSASSNYDAIISPKAQVYYSKNVIEPYTFPILPLSCFYLATTQTFLYPKKNYDNQINPAVHQCISSPFSNFTPPIHAHPIRSSFRNPSSPHASTHTAYIIPQTNASCSETVTQTNPTRKASKHPIRQPHSESLPFIFPKSLMFPFLQPTYTKTSHKVYTTSPPQLHGYTSLQRSTPRLSGCDVRHLGVLADTPFATT
jgi:hypothetical protein